MVQIFDLVHRSIDHPVSTLPTYTNTGVISESGLGNNNGITSNTIVGYSRRDSKSSTDNSQKVYGSGVLNLTNDKLIRQSSATPITKNANKEVLIRTRF